MKIFVFGLKFHWNLFPVVQYIADQATSHYLKQWRSMLLTHICGLISWAWWTRYYENSYIRQVLSFKEINVLQFIDIWWSIYPSMNSSIVVSGNRLSPGRREAIIVPMPIWLVWKRIGVMLCKKSAYPNCSGALTNCPGTLITAPEDL